MSGLQLICKITILPLNFSSGLKLKSVLFKVKSEATLAAKLLDFFFRQSDLHSV